MINMKKTPCEIIVWDVLPCIRRELAEDLKEYGLHQKEIAEKIGVTDAAISQYLSEKRGAAVTFDDDVQGEIKKSARKIYNGGNVIDELCHICSIVKEKKGFEVPCGV